MVFKDIDELSQDDFPLRSETAVSEQLERSADATLTAMQRDTFGGILVLLATVNYPPLLGAVAAGLCNKLCFSK